AFDVSILEILNTLATGAHIHLVQDILALTQPHHPTHLISTVPSAFAEVLNHTTTPITADTIIFAGEPLTRTTIEHTRNHIPNTH
ncbi:hypothetical protein IU498_34550, partial [Nocardia beijingensis]|uniref:hypothetical protein n=1 Tax=Nocardia beijingensis TaxID=95162 RepID=UPI001895A0E7